MSEAEIPRGPRTQGGDGGQQRRERDGRAHERIWELLPWYVNGTLAAAERREVEEHLDTCRGCREEVEECRRLSAAVREVEEASPSPHPIQLARLMARLDQLDQRAERAEINAAGDDLGSPPDAIKTPDAIHRPDASRAPHAPHAPHPPHPPQAINAGDETRQRPKRRGRSRQSSGRFGVLFAATPRAVRWTLAAQLALMAVLAGGWLTRSPAAGQAGPSVSRAHQYQVLSEAAPPGQIRLVFTDGATARQIRELLLRVHGRVVGGPTPIGSYTVEIGQAVGGREPVEPLAILVAYLRDQPEVRFAEPLAETSETANQNKTNTNKDE